MIEYNRKTKVEGTKEESCATCKGRGRVMQQVQTMFGITNTQVICPDCQGIGHVYTKNGKVIPGGLETTKQEVEVNIPAGIKDGVYIRHVHKGDDGIGDTHSGDLYVQIKVKPHKYYSRKDNDLYLTTDVNIFDLVLGQEITVPHPTGDKTIKIPKGTQVTDKIKVSKLGFENKGIFNANGDMYIIPKLHIPKKLSKQEEQLRNELKNLQQG